MSYHELVKWRQYFAIRPFGAWAEDYRIGQLCALHANLHRDPKKKSEPWTAQDFMLTEQIAKANERKNRRGVSPETTAYLFALAGVPVPDNDPVEMLRSIPNVPAHILAKYGGKLSGH